MAIAERVRKKIRASKRQDMSEGIIDIQERRAQQTGNGISVNVTDVGRRVHSLQQSEEMIVVVHEDGIWMEPKDE